MKFEQLLQLYWVRGFLYGGLIFDYDQSSTDLFSILPGFGRYSTNNFAKRLEFTWFFTNKLSCLTVGEDYQILINVYFSQTISIHHAHSKSDYYWAVRSYLIRSFQGWRQSLGYPSRGQRARSNGKNAFKVKSIVRDYISDFKKNHIKIEEVISLDFRKLRLKQSRKSPKYRRKFAKKKTNLWF